MTPLWFWEVDTQARWMVHHYILREWVREIHREAVLEALYDVEPAAHAVSMK